MPALTAEDHWHKGTHSAFMKEVVYLDEGRLFRHMCQELFRLLFDVYPEDGDWELLWERGEGILILCICDWLG